MIEPGDWGMNPRQPGRADLRFSRLGRRGFRAEIKLHRRRLLRPGRGLEIGLVLETKRAGEKDRRDALDGGIIVARGVVESSAFDGDAVLRAFELRLEHLETGAAPARTARAGPGRSAQRSGSPAPCRPRRGPR